MAIPPTRSIREVLLQLVHETQVENPDGNFQQNTVLRKAAQRLVSTPGDRERETAILTQWGELFRTGLLAWGFNLSNPNPPFFHLTEFGTRALANATRDPSNPAGYLKHLEARVTLDPIAKGYLVEGLDCYVGGMFKAAAVMVGAAAERIIIEVRDDVLDRRAILGVPSSRELKGWQIRPITTSLTHIFDVGIDRQAQRDLRERYETYWSALSGQIRTARNDAGHPNSIDPITSDTVHASFLIFPELAGLAAALRKWVADDMQ